MVVKDHKHGDDIEHWIHVVMEVNVPDQKARATFTDTEDGSTKTYGWFELPESRAIASIGIGPDKKWMVDDIRIRNWATK